jgi:hypothetical protein
MTANNGSNRLHAIDVTAEAQRLLATIADSGRGWKVVDRLDAIRAELLAAAAEVEPVKCSIGECLADASDDDTHGRCRDCADAAVYPDWAEEDAA